jgi:hypothetical protein
MARKAFTAGEPRVDYEELGELLRRKHPKNPKRHDLDFLDEAYKENDFAELPIIDEGTGKIMAGHGRSTKLDAMFKNGEDPPGRIQVRDGKWFVPVIRGMTFRHPEKHLLASNRGVELGGWDNGLLSKMLAKMGEDNLVGTGFDNSDLVGFMKGERGPQIPDMTASYSVIVECKGEKQQVQLLKRFQSMGLKVRAIVS